MKDFLNFIRTLIVLIIILFVVFYFIIGIKMVPNDDMEPRLSAGDFILYYKIDRDPNLRDVIVLKKNDTEYVGRVIAVSGDKVEITKDEILMVNDNMVVESKIYYSTPYYEGFVDYPITLAQGECFVLCDMREGGEDSRYYGPVRSSEILGTVIGMYRRGGL